MATHDLTTVIVVGALVGLLFVAIGYAQVVWFTRQRPLRGARADAGRARLRTGARWCFTCLAALCLVRAWASRDLADHRAFLVGLDLFAVRPRAGYIAKYETSRAEVEKGQVLLRFTGEDGEEASLAARSRREQLLGELEIERNRPLELDPELLRRVDSAASSVRDAELRLKQLISERDAIAREANQQELALANRSYRVEQDGHAAEREIGPRRDSLETQRTELRMQERLLDAGLVSRLELARTRDAVKVAEGRIGQLRDEAGLFARERREVMKLRASADRTFAKQLADRTEAIASARVDVERSRESLASAEQTLERDRPRAADQRSKRLQQIAAEVAESEAIVEGHGHRAVVEAPFSGVVGFREPSPSSPPADGGPLLVLYRPGTIGATVRLEQGEVGHLGSDLTARVEVSSPEGTGEGTILLPGAVAQRTMLPGGDTELWVSCEPSDRTVRALSMGGSVPAVLHLRQGLWHLPSWWIGIALAVVVLFVEVSLPSRSGRSTQEEMPKVPSCVDGPIAVSLTARQRIEGLLYRGRPARAGRLGWPRILRVSPPAQECLLGDGHEKAAIGTGLAVASENALGPTAEDGSSLRWFEEASRLPELGVAMRREIERGTLSADLVRRASEAAGGYRSMVLLGAGFGASVDARSIERAALGMLAAASAETLGDATQHCAVLLRLMRTLGAERLNGALDRLRAELVLVAVDIAERDGLSSERAATLVAPLVES